MSENAKSNPSIDNARPKKEWTPPRVRAYGNIHEITLSVLATKQGSDGAAPAMPAKSH
jgi:hypothetical protein